MQKANRSHLKQLKGSSIWGLIAHPLPAISLLPLVCRAVGEFENGIICVATHALPNRDWGAENQVFLYELREEAAFGYILILGSV